MKRPLILLLLLFVALALAVWLIPPAVQPSGGAKKKGPAVDAEAEADKAEKKRIARGRELIKVGPAIGTPGWMTWFTALPVEDQLAYYAAFDEDNAPPAATKTQIAAATIRPYSPAGSQLFSAKLLVNYKPLLRLDEGVPIRALQVETIRSAHGFVTTMWARRARDSIVVDWGNNLVRKGIVDNIRDVGGPVSHWYPHGMDFRVTGTGELLLKRSNKPYDFDKIPWKRQSMVYALAMDPGYEFGFGMERMEGGDRSASIVIVNIPKKEIAEIMPVPKCMSLDVTFSPREYLLVFEWDWQWIMLLDLSKPNVSAETVPQPEAKP